jgi:hypothetical protein
VRAMSTAGEERFEDHNHRAMKTCPSCHKTYEDETMMFCLVDGAKLLQPTAADPNATFVLPPLPVTEPGPPVASPQSTLRAQPELMQMGPRPYAPDFDSPERTRRSALPWLLGIVIVLSVSGIVIALILTRGRSEPGQQVTQTATPTTSPAQSGAITTESEPSPPVTQSQPVKQKTATTPTPAPKPPEQQPKKVTERALPGSVTVTRAPPPVQTPETRPKPMFGPLMDNITFTGTNLTYYPRTSPGLCEADCARNASCRGFTWVKPGGYNPGDSAMCYLISYVKGRVSHRCCMSAVKN